MSVPPPGATVPALTLSAAYGTGGSVIAPLLAAQLGLELLDRVVPAIDGAATESASAEETAATPANRWLAFLAHVATVVPSAPVPTATDLDPEVSLRRESEAAITGALHRPTLLLGRAAAVVLAGRPGVFHVRLHGPPERRRARACEIEGIDQGTARARQQATDRARDLFVRRLYDRNPAAEGLYHLSIDSTVVPLDTVVELVAAAAPRFWAAAGLRPLGTN